MREHGIDINEYRSIRSLRPDRGPRNLSSRPDDRTRLACRRGRLREIEGKSLAYHRVSWFSEPRPPISQRSYILHAIAIGRQASPWFVVYFFKTVVTGTSRSHHCGRRRASIDSLCIRQSRLRQSSYAFDRSSCSALRPDSLATRGEPLPSSSSGMR